VFRKCSVLVMEMCDVHRMYLVYFSLCHIDAAKSVDFCLLTTLLLIICLCFFVSQTVVLCAGCSMMLCQPTGGRCRLTEGCSFRRKVD
jgi:hypothetical protein